MLKGVNNCTVVHLKSKCQIFVCLKLLSHIIPLVNNYKACVYCKKKF